MKNKQIRNLLCYYDVNIINICLFFVFLLLFYPITIVYAKQYASCSDDIVNQFKNEHNYKSIEELNRNFHFYAGSLDSDYNGHYLFELIKKLKVDEIIDEKYLTCNFEVNKYYLCENSRIISNKECTTKTIIFDNGNKTEVDIDSCASFANQKSREGRVSTNDDGTQYTEKIACYPQNHICNNIKSSNLPNSEYYKVDANYIDNKEKFGERFYIYKKNIILSGMNKNCEFKKFSCDFKVKNESTISGDLNVVYFFTNNKYNKQFKENILANFNDEYAFFKYEGKCKISECRNVNINGKIIDVMKAPYYFKYVVEEKDENNNNIQYVYYYIKNITMSTKGVVCDSYLPICREIKTQENSIALYNNVLNSSNNTEARKSYYGNLKDKIREENLWFINSNSALDTSCLGISGIEGNEELDIGYCSDLNDDQTLKYKNGLETNDNYKPNCYLKSCIDLMPEEIQAIGSNQYKYCSEFYWLKNDKGFKYFPKQKPSYCSDIENNKLKFADGIENDISYGGGINSDNSNCYLKNCFSLNDNERKLVAQSKTLNLKNEYKRAFNVDNKGDLDNNGNHIETDFNKNNIAKYCDNGFLFDKTKYEDFDYFNLNIIPCYAFSGEQLAKMQRPMILFTDPLIKKYDTNTTTSFCRTHYIPLNGIGLQNSISLFSDVMAITADERNQINNNGLYTQYFENTFGKLDNYNNDNNGIIEANNGRFGINIGLPSDYMKLSFSMLKSSASNTPYTYTNICKYVDNNFLYYNADVSTYEYDSVNNNLLSLFKEEILQKKRSDFYNCLKDIENTELTDNEKRNIPQECVNCYTSDNPNECMAGESNCKKYVREYICKKKNCNGENDKICNTFENYMYDLVDCSKYLAKPETSSYFDCGLYIGLTNLDNSIVKNFNKNVDSSLITKIKEGCESTLPVIDNRNLLKTDRLSAILKPFLLKNSESGFNSNAKGNPANYLYSNYGCSKFEEPKGSNGLQGCKLPSVDSSYMLMFNESRQSEYISNNSGLGGVEDDKIVQTYYGFPYNNVLFSNEIKEKPSEAKLKINICTRYPSTHLESDNCGQRQGSRYADKCLPLVYKGPSGENTVNVSDSSGSAILSNSIGGVRFRGEKHGRGLYVFRDFYTFSSCFNTNNSDYFDGKAFGIVFGESIMINPFFFWIMIAIRIFDYRLSLQNDLFVSRDYYNSLGYKDRGYLTRATILNNDNYLYNYYPRSENIEIDIKNKLESNKDSDGNRYYHGNTLSSDIIKKCKIQNLLKMNSTNCNDGNCDYIYDTYYLNDDGSIAKSSGDNGKCNKNNTFECLTETQKECLNSFGIKFINNPNIDSNLRAFKYYRDGAILSDGWGTTGKDDGVRGWLPVDFVYFTKDTQTDSELKNNKNCKMLLYGDPAGDLSRCRGFYDGSNFYTESQSLQEPLFTSPFLFYTTITPRNTPELFDPTLSLESYCHFIDCYDDKEKMTIFNGLNSVILNFFNPKLKYSYSFVNGVSDSSYLNLFKNNYVSSIDKFSQYSYPYVAKYKSTSIPTERNYNYYLEKKYTINLYGAYTPIVCLNKLTKINIGDGGSDLNKCLNISSCTSDYCSELDSQKKQCFITTSPDIECYEREIPFLNNFILKPDTDIYYNNPIINVFLRQKASISYKDIIVDGPENYAMLQGDSEKVNSFAINKVQGFGLNFERSYCSKIYYDYYIILDKIERENKKIDKDITKINNWNKTLNTIETIVKTDCDLENGLEMEILVNKNEMKTIYDTKGKKENVVFKKIAKVKKYNESYGAFNEICVADKDIENILNVSGKQKKQILTMPYVLTFADKNKTQRKTKCLLNYDSRNRKECLVSNIVYVECSNDEKYTNSECVNNINIANSEYIYVKPIDCLQLLKDNYISDNLSDNLEDLENRIELIKVCYKGGFNYSENIYDKDGNLENICSCEILNDVNSEYNNTLFQKRVMTPREYGLCVDLKKPDICPAVKYYDGNRLYVDDNLALGKTKDELTKIPASNYEQHIWRSTEKQFGIIPSVFFSSTLKNAEFPSSVYCEVDNKDRNEEFWENNCIGGNKYVSGECGGFWKQSNLNSPKSICSSYQTEDGIVYEYRFFENPCEVYSCPNIGYNSVGNKILDESKIKTEDSLLFSSNELSLYDSLNINDYKTYNHKEDSNVNSVDKRGSNNGFAIWREVKIEDFDGDGIYAKKITATDCLTGFAPAGVNNINLNTDYTESSINYNSPNLNSILELYKSQHSIFNDIVMNTAANNGSTMPNRICNQKGEWMTVNDIYNLKLINKNIQNENYYYRNKSFFSKIFKDKEKHGLIDPNIEYQGGIRIDSVNTKSFCERLICPEIIVENNNIYNYEVFDSKFNNINKKTVFKHSGGANWEEISSPRNTSATMTLINSTINSSVMKYVFDLETENSENEKNKYKYVKKVKGICETNYGYYNRNTVLAKDFDAQLSQIINKLGKGYDINLKKEPLIDENSSEGKIIEPTRMCTSIGIWDGIRNRCFRACEMINLYNTNINEDLYKNNKNYEIGNNYFIDNHDIFSIHIPNDGPLESDMEKRFDDYNLLKNLTDIRSSGHRYADYLTGGASWPRYIVSMNSSIEQNGPKKGLRYIEVKGTCDSSYETENANKVRKYVNAGFGNTPKRKCYEDGTWGSVYGDTRCVLDRNCKTFELTLLDLYDLIFRYNNGTSLANINKYLAENIVYRKQINSVDAELANFRIGKFESVNVDIDAENSSIVRNLFQPYSGFNNSIKDISSNLVQLICNRTADAEIYPSGWSLENRDLGLYFVPRICNLGNIDDFYKGASLEDSNSIRDHLERVVRNNTIHYSKSSKLDLIYNKLNPDKNQENYKNTSEPNYSRNDIKIGSKEYKSYQATMTCNNDVFYNELDIISNGDTQYYNKNIVVECDSGQNEICSNNSCPNGIFKYIEYYNKASYTNNIRSSGIIKASDCKPKYCGGFNNKYQSNWGISYIKEFVTGNFSKISEENNYNSESVMACEPVDGIARSFIVDIDKYNKSQINNWNVEYYEIYGSLGFVSKFKSMCSRNWSGNKLNGQEININSYDAHRLGELKIDNVPTKLCTDLTKNNCNDVTEKELLSDKNFKSKYCVPMACSGKNMKLENGKIIYATGSDTFNLPNNYYNFDDVVVVQSFNGDFNSSKIYDSALKNTIMNNNYKIYTMYTSDTSNKVNICQSGQDVYNSGVTPYSLDMFLNNDYNNDIGKQTEIRSCFSNLEDEELGVVAVQKTFNGLCTNNTNNNVYCPEGYKEIYSDNKQDSFSYGGGSACTGFPGGCFEIPTVTVFSCNKTKYCIKYKDSYLDSLSYGRDLKNAADNYLNKISDEKKNELIEKAVNYIYANILFKDNKNDIFDLISNNEFITEEIKADIQKYIDRAKTSSKVGIEKDINKYCSKDIIVSDISIDDENNEDVVLFKKYNSNNNIEIKKTIINDTVKYVYLSAELNDKCIETTYSNSYAEKIEEKLCANKNEIENDIYKQVIVSETNYNILGDANDSGYETTEGSIGNTENPETTITVDWHYRGNDEICNFTDGTNGVYVYKEKSRTNNICVSNVDFNYENIFIDGDNQWRKTSEVCGTENIDKKPLYIDIVTFNRQYEENFVKAFDKEKINIRNNLNDSSNIVYSKLVNMYGGIYITEDFLKNEKEEITNEDGSKSYTYKNMNYYNNYFNNINNSFSVIFTGNDILYFLAESSSVDSDNTTLYNLKINNNILNCSKNISTNDINGEVIFNEFECSDDDYLKLSDSIKKIKDNYNLYFINFLISADENSITYKDNIKSESEQDNCIDHFKNYSTKVTNYNPSASLSNGYYIAMKCTPNGWYVYDEPSCKNRCSSDRDGNFNVYLDPEGDGDFGMNLSVNNLRYNRTISSSPVSHADGSCYRNNYTRNSRITMKCTDNGIEKIEPSYNNYEGVSGWDRWYNWSGYHECIGNAYLYLDNNIISKAQMHWSDIRHNNWAQYCAACPNDIKIQNDANNLNVNCANSIDNVTTIKYLFWTR